MEEIGAGEAAEPAPGFQMRLQCQVATIAAPDKSLEQFAYLPISLARRDDMPIRQYRVLDVDVCGDIRKQRPGIIHRADFLLDEVRGIESGAEVRRGDRRVDIGTAGGDIAVNPLLVLV